MKQTKNHLLRQQHAYCIPQKRYPSSTHRVKTSKQEVCHSQTPHSQRSAGFNWERCESIVSSFCVGNSLCTRNGYLKIKEEMTLTPALIRDESLAVTSRANPAVQLRPSATASTSKCYPESRPKYIIIQNVNKSQIEVIYAKDKA